MRRRRITSHSCEGAAVDINRALALREQAVDEFESCGFAGAAAAQEDQGFAALDFEIQIAEKFVARCLRR